MFKVSIIKPKSIPTRIQKNMLINRPILKLNKDNGKK